ncbi:chemotaxis protein CheX [Clostridiaceae bacterium HSG29]|nr:chemotaxis protein CheX [Clostridiaceae bacterium HSG29]
MKVEYINPFIKASKEVFKMTMNLDLEIGRPYVKKTPFALKDVVLVVGITGEVKGQVIINFEMEIAKKIASKMMMGMEVSELDEMSKSAISELGNMIMGNTATLIANQGIAIDITPPTLMIGKEINLSFSDSQTIGLPLHSELGDIIYDIALKEN